MGRKAPLTGVWVNTTGVWVNTEARVDETFPAGIQSQVDHAFALLSCLCLCPPRQPEAGQRHASEAHAEFLKGCTPCY